MTGLFSTITLSFTVVGRRKVQVLNSMSQFKVSCTAAPKAYFQALAARRGTTDAALLYQAVPQTLQGAAEKFRS